MNQNSRTQMFLVFFLPALLLLIAPGFCNDPCENKIVPLDPESVAFYTMQGNFDAINGDDFDDEPQGVANAIIRLGESEWIDLNQTQSLGLNAITSEGRPAFVILLGNFTPEGDIIEIIALKEADTDGDGREEVIVSEQNPDLYPVGLGRLIGGAFWYPQGSFFEEGAQPIESIGGELVYCEVESSLGGRQAGTFTAQFPSKTFPMIDPESIEPNEGLSIFEAVLFESDGYTNFGFSSSWMKIDELGDMDMNNDPEACRMEGTGCPIALGLLDERANEVLLYLGDFADPLAPVIVVDLLEDAIQVDKKLFLDGSEGLLLGWSASSDFENGQNPRYEACDGEITFDAIGAGSDDGERFAGQMWATLLGPFNDCDRDGIGADGEDSGQARGDNSCRNGNTDRCDDNCPTVYNPDQADSNRNAIGDACEF